MNKTFRAGTVVVIFSTSIKLENQGFPTLFHSYPETKIQYIAVFNFDRQNDEAVLVPRGPVSFDHTTIDEAEYRPCGAIKQLTPLPIATNRYGPIRPLSSNSCVEGR
jgi:hypothetical protein